MPFLPPWLRRLNPMTAILADKAELAEVNTEKSITALNEGDLVFGEIAAATDVVLGFEYAATEDEQFVMGAGILYEGDAGAFQILADNYGTLAAPIALVTGSLRFLPIPPDSYGNDWTLTIRALAANDGVAKAGTLTIIDRFDFSNSAATVRAVKVLPLSKTYNAP